MIESPKNRVFKDIRRLKRCKGDSAVLEGPHLLRVALAAGVTLDSVLATPEALAGESGALLADHGLTATTVAPRALESVADSDSPRGVLAVARLPRTGADQLPLVEHGIYLFLDELQDPGNLGAVARAAEASGAAGLALSAGCAHPNHPRALRAAAGSLLRFPVAIGVEPDALAERLASLAPTWYALSAQGADDLYEIPLTPPLILVVGGERGLDPTIESSCDRRVRIPMTDPVESLNAAVATAIVLYELRRRLV